MGNKTENVQILHEFSDISMTDYVRYHAIVRIKDKVLVFGGHVFSALDIIYEYDINDKKWSKLHHKLPKALSGCGCTSILNGQYVVLFGGCNKGNKDDIWIYCVRDETFTESNIICPKQGHHQAYPQNHCQQDRSYHRHQSHSAATAPT